MSVIIGGAAHAQPGVGIGTSLPHSTALLHVELGSSLSRGVIFTGIRDNSATFPNLGAGTRLMFYPGKVAFRAGEVSGTQWDAINTGARSVAMRYNTIANGENATAFGFSNLAGGSNATVMGSNSIASGFSSVAMGSNVTASGTNAVAMGSTTTASGIYAVAMGTGSAASGGNSTAMGYFTRAMGTVSTTAGLGVTAKALAAVSIGAYNDDTDNPDADAPAPADCIFQIGIGISNATRSNAITVLRNGNVGLGALDPAYRLDIRGRARIRSGGTGPTSAGIWLNRNDNSALAGFVGVDGNNDLGIYTSNNASWSFLVHITTGNVTVKGNVTANGVTLTSDERLKKDITPLNDAMPLLEKLHGYQYHWKNETTDAGLQTGLLAQEVEKVMPTLVKTDDKGRKSVNYMGLIPYLLEGMKAQQQQIKEMKEVIQAFVQK